MQPDQPPIGRWSAAAPFWEKYREIILQMFAPVTQALVEDASIGSGHAVLDIATGPGEPALSVAALVGPEGKVNGVDPAPEMIAAARRAAEHGGIRKFPIRRGLSRRSAVPGRHLRCRGQPLRCDVLSISC